MSLEKTYIDYVLSANKAYKDGSVQDFYRESNDIFNISRWSTTAALAIINHVDYEQIKKSLKIMSEKKQQTENTANNKYGFIYIAKQLNEKNLYKIGCTDDISKRLNTFKVGNCFVDMIASKPVQDKYFSEKWFHNYFNTKKYKNEWFLLNTADLRDLAEIFGFNFHIKSDSE